MKKLCEIFNIENSNSLELINCEESEKGVCFISRTSNNNGVVARIKKLEWLNPMPANALTVALGGSVLSTFYQDEPFYTAFHIACLYPKRTLTKEQMLYYAYVIETNKYKYNYGRQANKTLKDILVPNIDELPDYINNLSLDNYKLYKTPILNKKIQLNIENWEWVDLKNILQIERGGILPKINRKKGNIPLVTAGRENEGVAEYISNEEMKRYKNAITIDVFGNCFYREYTFCCDCSILVLLNSNLNSYSGLFLSTIINFDKYKFTCGRYCRQKNFKQHKIKLPVKTDNTLDWQFMEDYIKSLPYSTLCDDDFIRKMKDYASFLVKEVL